MPDPLADLAQLAGVPSAIAAAMAAVDVVLRDRGLRAVNDEQRGPALAAGAEANAALTGDPDRWLVGALRLSAELASPRRADPDRPGSGAGPGARARGPGAGAGRRPRHG